MSTENRAPVIVVGAGIGGLSAAVRLAVAGKRVIVFEKNAAVGGKMYQFSADGFRWDTGPSVITMRHVLDELFASAGRKLGDYVKLRPLDPLTRYFYADGTALDVTRDLPALLDQIAAIEPRDVEGFLRYLAYAARLHRITGPVFIYDRPPTPASFLRVPVMDWLKVDPFRTMDGAIRHFVKSPHLRQLLGRFATYVGASPYQAPATLNVIAHVELNGGVWYPEGGVYALAAALEQLAQEVGVEIYTNSAVEEIVISQASGAAEGVITNGELVAAEAVIANVDVTTVYERLLPQSGRVRQRLAQLVAAEPSCSGFVLLLGVNKRHPTLAHHNIFFARDYPAEFRAIFQEGVMPQEPTIYVAITSKTDASHAPTGGENWFVLVNAPPVGSGWDWEAQTAAYRDHLLSRLAAWGYDLRPHLASEHVLTPVDLARMSGAQRGALYGPSSNDRMAAFRRPHNRCPDVAGLYFAGGTTHPGGGVPMVTLSGKVAAELLLADFG